MSDFAFNITQQNNRSTGLKPSPEITTKDFSVVVFPNPNEGSFNLFLNNVSANDTASCYVRVFDLSGRIILEQVKPAINFFRFSLGDVAKGCYFIQIKKGNISKSKKINIQ